MSHLKTPLGGECFCIWGQSFHWAFYIKVFITAKGKSLSAMQHTVRLFICRGSLHTTFRIPCFCWFRAIEKKLVLHMKHGTYWRPAVKVKPIRANPACHFLQDWYFQSSLQLILSLWPSTYILYLRENYPILLYTLFCCAYCLRALLLLTGLPGKDFSWIEMSHFLPDLKSLTFLPDLTRPFFFI